MFSYLQITDWVTQFIYLSLLAILVTGNLGLQSCEMLRIPHVIDNQLTYVGKDVGPKQRMHFIAQKRFSASGTHFC
jgi:hypothetical protein